MTDKHLGGHGSLLIAYIIFGLNVPIMKSVLADGELTSLAIAFLRFTGATAIFWIVSLFLPREKVPFRDKLLLFCASIFGVFLCQFLFSLGLYRTSPIDAAVINTVSPIMTMILAAFFLKEPVTWKKAIGVFIGASGALLLILSEDVHDRGGASLAGNLIVMLSTLSFVIYLTAFKNLIMRYSPVTLMKWMFLFATVCGLPFCWRDVSAIDYKIIPAGIWLKTSFVIVMATFLSYLLIPIGQRYLRPTIVSMYNYIQPIVSSLVAVAIGMDVFGWKKAASTLLVFVGVYVVTQSKSRAQLEAEKTKAGSGYKKDQTGF